MGVSSMPLPLSSKGQLVILRLVRQALGLDTVTHPHIQVEDGTLILEPVASSVINALYGKYAGTDLLAGWKPSIGRRSRMKQPFVLSAPAITICYADAFAAAAADSMAAVLVTGDLELSHLAARIEIHLLRPQRRCMSAVHAVKHRFASLDGS